MEPETSAPKLEPEKAPVELGPERVLEPTPERGLLETGAEKTEQIAEKTATRSDHGVAPTTIAPTAIVGDDSTTDNSMSLSTPAVAADDDLIEKEWVDRAKKIVSDTRDDPYEQENAVTKLQRDYKKKRYGRELGEAS